MATLQPLTQADLDYTFGLLIQGNISRAYDFLSSKGCQYADLANGVVNADSLS